MPKGKPKKGYRKPGGGRPKKTFPKIILVVRETRSKSLWSNEIDGPTTGGPTKSTVLQLSTSEKELLQRKINGLSDDQRDHLLDSLGYRDNDCEVSIDLDLMEGAQQRVLAKFVDELCCAAIAYLQAKVDRLATNQLEEVITFLSPFLGCQAVGNQTEVRLDWTSLPASRKQELDELLDKLLNA